MYDHKVRCYTTLFPQAALHTYVHTAVHKLLCLMMMCFTCANTNSSLSMQICTSTKCTPHQVVLQTACTPRVPEDTSQGVIGCRLALPMRKHNFSSTEKSTGQSFCASIALTIVPLMGDGIEGAVELSHCDGLWVDDAEVHLELLHQSAGAEVGQSIG